MTSRRPGGVQHPVQCCFISVVPVSTALIGIALHPYALQVAQILATVGIVGRLIFGVYRTGQLPDGGPRSRDDNAGAVSPSRKFRECVYTQRVRPPEWGALFFGVGVLSWLAFESAWVQRLYTVSELPPPLRPTLGIQLAPPTVGCSAYLSITSGQPDLLAQMLLGYGLFQALLLIRLIPWIVRQPFAPSYRAFTFGLSALAICLLRFAESAARSD
jgi:tellurite resistance protein